MKKKNYKKKYELFRRMYWILFLISLVAITTLGSSAIYFQYKYDILLEVSAENNLGYIKLGAACMQMNNVTVNELMVYMVENGWLEETERRYKK